MPTAVRRVQKLAKLQPVGVIILLMSTPPAVSQPAMLTLLTRNSMSGAHACTLLPLKTRSMFCMETAGRINLES